MKCAEIQAEKKKTPTVHPLRLSYLLHNCFSKLQRNRTTGGFRAAKTWRLLLLALCRRDAGSTEEINMYSVITALCKWACYITHSFQVLKLGLTFIASPSRLLASKLRETAHYIVFVHQVMFILFAIFYSKTPTKLWSLCCSKDTFGGSEMRLSCSDVFPSQIQPSFLVRSSWIWWPLWLEINSSKGKSILRREKLHGFCRGIRLIYKQA